MPIRASMASSMLVSMVTPSSSGRFLPALASASFAASAAAFSIDPPPAA